MINMFSKLKDFIVERQANVALTTALCALPLFGSMGLAFDYAMELTTKTKLDSAADAAAVAAIAKANSVISANGGLTADSLTQAQVAAAAAFKANAGSIPLAGLPVPNVAVTRSGRDLTASVSFVTTQTNVFGKIFNVNTSLIRGSATATMTIASYLDFYLLLDVSGSMGIPSTVAGQNQLAAINPDLQSQYPTGCNFACHVPGYQGFGLARSNNIQLRADAVGNAVCQLLATAQSTTTLSNQYRVGIYPFIVDMETFFSLSSNLNSAITAVTGNASGSCSASSAATTIGNLLDWGDTTNPMGSGGTHFDIALPHMSTTVTAIGDGSSSLAPRPFVFLVTDGVENYQGWQGSGVPWWNGGSQPANIDPTLCTPLKNRGITLAVLYIPYQPIANPNPSFAGDEDGKVNSIIAGPPGIPSKLAACASPGFYFTANTPADISTAMQTMFAQAVQAARLSQ